VLLGACSKSDDRAEPVKLEKHAPESGKAAKMENRLWDQTYSAVMWLEYAKLVNHRLLDKRKESGYQLAEAIITFNKVLSTQGLRVEALKNGEGIPSHPKVKQLTELITSVSNSVSTTAQKLGIDWYQMFKAGGSDLEESRVTPQLKDLIFIAHLLESESEKDLLEFAHNYFEVDLFLEPFIEEDIKTGTGTIPYFFNIQFEIYAKSLFHYASRILPSSELMEVEQEIVWSNLLASNKVYSNKAYAGKSSEHTIYYDLIEADRRVLAGKAFSSASPLENWYLTTLRAGGVDICNAVEKLKQLNKNYYVDHSSAFEECDCWQDYSRYMITISMNLLALQREKGGDWLIQDSHTLDCLEAVTDHYFEVTREPKDFRYGKISHYFLVSYAFLAFENGSHQPFFLQYMVDQVSEDTFVRALYSLYSELTMYSPGGA
jgi:hypothetical protein|tara:strand:+ start:7290 stop:8585 length:1296 start_codon:yes stop_codon:yes gene_type:complete